MPRNLKLTGAALAIAALLGGCTHMGWAPSAADKTVLLTNRTDHALTKIYIDPAGVIEWNFVFGWRPLAPGQSTPFRFGGGTDTCLFDVRARFDDYSHRDVYRFNACRNAELVFQ